MKYRVTLTILLIAVLGAAFMMLQSTQQHDTPSKEPVVQSPSQEPVPNVFSTMKVN